MRRIKRILLCAILALAGIALPSPCHAGNKLSVKDVQIEPGGSMALDIALENETTNLMGWQCDIVLPAGLSLKLKANGKPIATLGDRFAETEHSISSSVTSTGAYRFIATSLNGEAIPGSSGTLFTVTLVADASLSVGKKLVCNVKNIEFNTQENKKLELSDVTFTVAVGDGAQMAETVYNLSKGWNWISTNLADEARRESMTFLSAISGKTKRVLSQTQELVNDPIYGMVGDLSHFDVTAGYKLQVSEAAKLTQTGAEADVSTPISLKEGWNWIGYLPTEAIAVSTALQNLQATEGDRVVSQYGFAEYDGTEWQGDFLMQPGKGYMYK